MKNEGTFAVRMDVEGAVQLVDRRSAVSAVNGRHGPAHLFAPPGSVALFTTRFNSRRGFARANEPGGRKPPGHAGNQYFLHSGFVRLGGPILRNTSLG